MTPKGQAPVEPSDDIPLSDDEIANEIAPRIVASNDEEISAASNVESTTENKTGRRRGVWRRIRVRPADAFETAESQHISQPAYNVLADEYSNKFDAKAAYNSFSKGYFGGSQENNQEIETASALTMEKDQEIVTDGPSALMKDEDEIVASLPEEVKFDAIPEEAEKEIFESTTVLPEIEEEADKVEQPVSTFEDTPATTAESIYDEVRKSLSELFSRAPEDEDEEAATDVAVTSEKEEINEPVATEAARKETTTTTTTETPTTTSEHSVVVDDNEHSTEIAHIVEISPEPEIKANVTEINRSYVIATSTSQQVSHETEICYRGRCIKTVESKKKN